MKRAALCAAVAAALLLLFAACGIDTPDPITEDTEPFEQTDEVSTNPDETLPDSVTIFVPEETTEPETTPSSELTPNSAPTPDSETTCEPETAPDSETTREPETAPVPDTTHEPETTPAIETTRELEMTPMPQPDLGKEIEILPDAPPQLPLLEPIASGTSEKRNALAVIDYSNTADGYIMAQYTEACSERLKVQVKGPKSTYTYNITPQKWEVFPLSEGDGSYQVTVYRNVYDSKYATELSVTFDVSLENEFTVFLYPNQYVNYTPAVNTVQKAYDLTKNIGNSLEKVAAVYDFVVDTLTYDKEKAATVQSGYLPVLDDVLAAKKGICFDYAALMTGMLRSQGIPCKLIVGYAGSAYHAWINVWSEESGWIDGVIFFDGVSWQRMDPTFASSANRSDSIMQYIGDGTNYTEKYLY